MPSLNQQYPLCWRSLLAAKTTSRVEGHLRNCQESSNPPRKKNIWIFWRGRSWSVVFFSNLCLAQKTTPKTPTPHLLERGFFHWFPGIQSIKITRKDICNCGLDPPSCVDWDGSPSWTVWLEALTGGAETLFTYDCSLYHSSPCLLVSSSRKKNRATGEKPRKADVESHVATNDG